MVPTIPLFLARLNTVARTLCASHWISQLARIASNSQKECYMDMVSSTLALHGQCSAELATKDKLGGRLWPIRKQAVGRRVLATISHVLPGMRTGDCSGQH